MKILMINVPYSGHTNPTLPLAKLLVQRGHAVSYINAEEFREKIEATGAAFIPYKDFPVAPRAQEKKMKCFRAAYDTALSLDEKFDVLIYEMFFYPGRRLAEKLNIPCVRQFSQPAWCEEMIASASPLLKISTVLIDAQVMGKRNKAHMQLENTAFAEAVLRDKAALNIVYVPEFFQRNRECFDDSYVFTVPAFTKSNTVRRVEIPYHEMRDPIVYISLGSIISSAGFCKKCIRAFGGKAFSIILNTGIVKPEKLGKLPDNIYAYSFVPQLEVLSHAQVFLTHCGMNSVNEALLAGVPMVAMPFINDQISNAERIVELGIGKRLRSFRSSEKDLYEAVLEASKNDTMKARCQELKAAAQNGTSSETVAMRIERM